MNNLYGWGLSGCLPDGGFECLKNVDRFDVNSIIEKSEIGNFLINYMSYTMIIH